MIRPATSADLPAVGAIYQAILDAEDARPRSYTNWLRGKYPTLAHARAALEAGTLWVLEEAGSCAGCVNLNSIQPGEYANIPWSIPAGAEEVSVIHTLCIHPDFARRGLAARFVAFCEEESRRQGKKVMRLDTYVGNLPANALYPRLGYTFAGATHFLFEGVISEVLNCYEKAL